MDETKDRTLWVGNIADDATDELLYELFLQAGPVERVTIPKDKMTGKQKNFAFITFKHEVSVPFCINVFDGIHLLRRRLQIKTRNGSVHTSGKTSIDPKKWGIGLLPHPSKGHGLLKPKNPELLQNGHGNSSPSSGDNNNEGYDTRRVVVNQDPSYLMPPPIGGAGYPQGMQRQLGYQGNPGQRNFQRSQTWPGIMELQENDSNGNDSQKKQKYDDRFRDDDSRERDSRDHKRRRFEESPRDRAQDNERDGRKVVRDNDRYDRSRSNSRNGSLERSGSYENRSPVYRSQRSLERGDGPVENQIQHMAQVQMQMIQQQNQYGRNRGGSQQYSGGGSYRRY